MTQETWTHPLSGLSFPDALAHITLSTGEQKQARGPILLTHFGISGPATFVVASYTAFEEITPEQPLKMHIQPLADQ
jgi:predicted flavoprotein YhiN